MGSNQHKSSGLALSLALVYCGLVAYASLYPFAPWQFQGVRPWMFVVAGWPRYWSGFDIAVNVIGYIPFGFLVAVAWRGAHRKHAFFVAVLAALGLSFCMESLQTYIAPRVASNVDWALNTLGASIGGMLAWMAYGMGLLQSWSRFRKQRFLVGSGSVLGLLLLWPLALLYPTPVPLGLGYGFGKWLDIDNQLLSDSMNSAVLALGFLSPLLIAYAITPRFIHRSLMLIFIAAMALGITTLSNGLSFGPEHAVVWLHAISLRGLWISAALSLPLLFMPLRLCWVLAFLCLLLQLVLVNIRLEDPYFTQTLAIWEQGRFIRFYGATQWLGLLWPYAALILICTRLSKN